MKQFYFLSGLPRSGSTLLSSILNQDERVYASANSPLLDMLYYNEQYWRDSEQGRANPKADSLKGAGASDLSATGSGMLDHSSASTPSSCGSVCQWIPQVKAISNKACTNNANASDLPPPRSSGGANSR